MEHWRSFVRAMFGLCVVAWGGWFVEVEWSGVWQWCYLALTQFLLVIACGVILCLHCDLVEKKKELAAEREENQSITGEKNGLLERVQQIQQNFKKYQTRCGDLKKANDEKDEKIKELSTKLAESEERQLEQDKLIGELKEDLEKTKKESETWQKKAGRFMKDKLEILLVAWKQEKKAVWWCGRAEQIKSTLEKVIEECCQKISKLEAALTASQDHLRKLEDNAQEEKIKLDESDRSAKSLWMSLEKERNRVKALIEQLKSSAQSSWPRIEDGVKRRKSEKRSGTIALAGKEARDGKAKIKTAVKEVKSENAEGYEVADKRIKIDETRVFNELQIPNKGADAGGSSGVN
ncbi:hypothetical protein BSKO_11328 [Bryopsis sp. KO-2023]|nr:hypothetical protein BSKO_11328 [Bryopsis sp. KO-2023]